MATVRQLPSGLWDARVSIRGVPMRKAHATEALARKWAADLEVARDEGKRTPATRKSSTVAAYGAKWWPKRRLTPNTLANQRSYWHNHVLPKWGRWRLTDITPGKVAEWIREMETAGKSATVIRDAASVLSALLSAAVGDDTEPLDGNPVTALPRGTKPPAPQPMRRSAEDGELAAILAAASDDKWRVMWQTKAETGLRMAELRGLRIGQLRNSGGGPWLVVNAVAEDDGTIRQSTKNGDTTGRKVPLTRALYAKLVALAGDRDEDLCVFTHRTRYNDGTGARPIPYGTAKDEWDRTVERAGVALKPHELRHTSVTTMLDAGVRPHVVMEIHGHADANILRRYTHVSDEMFNAARVARESATPVAETPTPTRRPRGKRRSSVGR